MDNRDGFRGALLGLACGDAVGATLEFQVRGSFTPITDMVGGGFAHLKAGEWTDDTAMAICLGNSLVANGFDLADQMNKYSDWVYKGYVAKGAGRFIGKTTYDAISRYGRYKIVEGGDSNPRSAGNGSIMRLVPVVMHAYPTLHTAILNSGQSSKTTHGSIECIEACMLFGEILHKALAGGPKENILVDFITPVKSPNILAIKNAEYLDNTEDEIDGSGYVVKSLEAALWCFHKTSNFRDAVLMAANLGNDADTTAAIVGQVAGAYYGAKEIPANWVEMLDQRDTIIALADSLYDISQKSRNEKE